MQDDDEEVRPLGSSNWSQVLAQHQVASTTQGLAEWTTSTASASLPIVLDSFADNADESYCPDPTSSASYASSVSASTTPSYLPFQQSYQHDQWFQEPMSALTPTPNNYSTQDQAIPYWSVYQQQSVIDNNHGCVQGEVWLGPQHWINESAPHAANQYPLGTAGYDERQPSVPLDRHQIHGQHTASHNSHWHDGRLPQATRALQRKIIKEESKSSNLPRPRRRGPLDSATRDKVEEMRDLGSCWRCRKYKKSCNGPGVCDSCLIPKFKIWPSSIGCRRESLESMTLFLWPTTLEEGLAKIPVNNQLRATWRIIPSKPVLRVEDILPADSLDEWAVSKMELLGTRYFDDDYRDLADIAATYQRSLPKPHKCLEVSRILLVATCKWHKCLVSAPDSPSPTTTATIITYGTAVRNATREAFKLLQQTCLSNKRTDWFPAFLSCLLIVCGAVYYMDGIMLMPEAARSVIWPDINNTRNDLRTKTYSLLIDLLRVSTRGINPIGLECWATAQTGVGSRKEEKIREKEREVLLGSDRAALQGLLALKSWQAKYQRDLQEGKQMFVQDMVEQARIRPIAGLWKMFEL